LTSCGHIFCTTCLGKNVDKKCSTCEQTYAGVIPLTSNLKPDVQSYFMNVKDLCKNVIKEISHVQLVAEFQKGHCQRLSTYHKQKLTKFGEMMQQARELERKYRDVSWERDKLKSFVASLGYQVNDILAKGSRTPYPSTPKTPATPGMKRTISNQLISSNMSQRPSPSNNRVTPGIKPMMRPGASPMQQSPSGSYRSLQPSPRGLANRGMCASASPSGTPKSVIAPGRISMRTPPINGKIGPIARSPYMMNSQLRTPTSSQIINNKTPSNRITPGAPQQSTSKIGQHLKAGNSSQSSTVKSSPQQTPCDERRPIQLASARSFNFSRRPDASSTPKQ